MNIISFPHNFATHVLVERSCLLNYRAAYSGTRIILRQVSAESEAIYDLILALYAHCHDESKSEGESAVTSSTNGNATNGSIGSEANGNLNNAWQHYVDAHGVSSENVENFREYAAQFLGNLGNYKGFGDSKFVPRCSKKDVQMMCGVIQGGGKCNVKVGGDIHEEAIAGMFVDEKTATEESMLLGFPAKGHVSGYYPDSPDLSQEEIEAIGGYIGGKKLLPENTRIRKKKIDGGAEYEILIASSLKRPEQAHLDTVDKQTAWTMDTGPLKGSKLSLVFGGHHEEMRKVAENMKKAGSYAANPTQTKMMQEYATSFETGSMNAFLESQKLWVSDIGPEVETNIGFIETYRDPSGIRGEWEGFVAMVNKERTQAFKKLVDAAPIMIPRLPWSKDFEKDQFTPPDFTSLEVLSFASSGIPAGINIPNQDVIRQNLGFKNVSLGNVLGAKSPNEPVPFIHKDDLSVYQDCRDAAFEVQVGIHELLGHGSGKLLQETAPGTFNFDQKNPPVSPVDGKPITTYYKANETWGTVFGPVASSYEECRAECVAMVLSCEFEILKVFGFGDGQTDLDSKAGDILYASYLSIARAGIIALEFWDPKSGKWGQIHMQARFAILKTFLEAGQDFCKLEYTDKETLSDLTLSLDRSKILSVGRSAVDKFLQKLHVYKSTANLQEGKKLYDEMTRVEGEFWQKKVRNAVLRKKVPRKVFVEANTTTTQDGEVKFIEYEPTIDGLMKSWVERNV